MIPLRKCRFKHEEIKRFQVLTLHWLQMNVLRFLPYLIAPVSKPDSMDKMERRRKK